MFKKYDERAREILATLTLKEKIGQLNQQVIPDPANLESIKCSIRRGEVGSIILCNSPTAGNDEQQAILVDMLNELQECAVNESRSGIPMLYARDVIHGHHTVYPIPLASACSFNPELVEKCYRCIAEEASAESVHWTFSPMVDVCREPRWGRIIEGPGEDPYVGARFAEAAVKGFQGDDLSSEHSMLACLKHYLGYGFSEGGRDYYTTDFSENTLYNTVLPAFRAGINAGAATVMSSFNDIGGQPVTSSKKYLTDILRGHLGFDGFVISDWFSVKQLLRQCVAETEPECVKMALPAGLDMDMADELYIRHLEKLVLDGEIEESVIDEAVLRVLRVKLAKGLFEKPLYDMRKVDRKPHIELSEQLAAESMILLKNEGNVLPITKDKVIALTGPFLNECRGLHGSWSLDGYEGASTPTFLQAMQDMLAGEKGSLFVVPETALFNGVSYYFRNSEVVVLALGESHAVTGEARSMADITISADQIEIARKAKACGKKVIGVLFCGRPLALETIEPYLDAILCAWHGGTRCAHAAAKTIFGEYNPSGRAAITFVRHTGHIPFYYNTTRMGREHMGYYGEHPASCYVDHPCDPMYAFGHGLSYTSFEYSDITLDKNEISLAEILDGGKIKASVKVKNTGERQGKETVQLYIRDLVASVMRPVRELKGFEKISLAAGEEKEVSFELSAEKLGFYKGDGTYTVEKGNFEIYIGESSLTKNKTEITLI